MDLNRSYGYRSLCAGAALVLFATGSLVADSRIEQVDVPPTPVPKQAVCGDGLVSGGETCETCATDCKPRLCKPAGRYKFAIDLQSHPAWEPTAATIHLSYRTDKLSLPGTASDRSVVERVGFGDSGSGINAIFDVDHSLRVVRAESKPIPKPMAVIEFDGCDGAPPPTSEDLDCVVEGCAYVGGVIQDGCFCIPRLLAD